VSPRSVAPSLLTLACSMALVTALLISATALAGGTEAPTPAVAAGIAAYHRGDFATALGILKPIVYDVAPGRLVLESDPWATAYLAQMFRRGEGTQADWPLSCALFTNALGHTPLNGPGGIGFSIPFVKDGIQEVCLTDSQSQPEVMALRQACYLDGVTRQTFVFDGATWIVVDRRGFHIDLGGEHYDARLGMQCHDVMVSLTGPTSQSPIDGPRSRESITSSCSSGRTCPT
jgi:hypothetical protein